MTNRFFLRSFLFLLSIAAIFNACRKSDVMLPDNLVSFGSSSYNITQDNDSVAIKLMLTRATDKNIAVTLNITPEGVVYGTDYTTTPESVNNVVSVTIPSGNNEAVFYVKKASSALYDGNEKLNIVINSSEAPVIIGAAKTTTVNFSEVISTNASAVIDGGGPTFGNKVFIDLSANRATSVSRINWDLGFYTGGDDFRVILNSSSAMMARPTTKTDMNQVSAADTVGISSLVAFSLYAPNPLSMPYFDYPSGDLTRTAFASVSANDAENMVYIVNRGMGIGNPAPERGWQKVRVLRSANGGYKVQYAPLNATSFQEVTVDKDVAYHFNYLSFDNGKLNIEPKKEEWDFAWTHFSNVTNFGGGEVPYLYQDMILLNRGVEAAEVLVANKPYESFGLSDLTGLSFDADQRAIGSKWRSGGGPTSSPAVKSDRYYIIKDANGNYYKLQFTALTQNGQRGYPAYQTHLVKPA